MSIYIKSIEMPTGCSSLTLQILPDGQVEIIDADGNWETSYAVSIPPHGDLIDRDEQIERAWRLNLSTRELIEEMLKSAPTIIPASEEGE